MIQEKVLEQFHIDGGLEYFTSAAVAQPQDAEPAYE